MGFLDKQSRVVDLILTAKGRRLYAAGRLDFAYFAPFDDGVDYDPYSTGTLTDTQRRDQVEAAAMFEVPFVPEVRGTTAAGEPVNHVFTAAGGFRVIPQMSHPGDGDEIDLMVDQRREGDLYRRTGTSLAQIDLQVEGDTEQGNPGFIVRVFSSGSNGLTEVDFRRDLMGRRAVDPFIALAIDSEPSVDTATVSRPDSVRLAGRMVDPKVRR